MPATKCDCVKCSLPNDIDDMVQCQECKKWCHFNCAGVEESVSEAFWVCDKCAEQGPKTSMKTRRPKSEKAMAVAKASQQPDLPEGKLQSEATPGISKELPAKPLPSPNTAKSHPENPTPTRQGSVASSRLSAQLALKRLEKEQELQKQILLAEKEKMEAGIRAKMAEMDLQHETQLNALKDEIENLSIYSVDSKRNRTAEWVKHQNRQVMEVTPEQSRRTEPPSQPILPATTSTSVAKHSRTADLSMAREMYPKKLPIFSGCPDEWSIFLNCYQESTKACGYTNGENTIRLTECLRGPALDAVQSKLRLPNAAPLIIKRLEKLFGKPAQLVRQLTERVRRLDPPKPEQLNSLITFGLEVINLCDHLTLSNLSGYFNNPELLADLVDKLPATRRLEWSRYKHKYPEPTLKEFGEFVETLVDDACDVTTFLLEQNKQGPEASTPTCTCNTQIQSHLRILHTLPDRSI